MDEADAKLSMLLAALRSLRADSLVKPYPVSVAAGQDRDHARLLERLDALAGPIERVLERCQQQDDDGDAASLTEATLALRWLLLPRSGTNGGSKVQLRRVAVEDVWPSDRATAMPSGLVPTHAFAIEWSDRDAGAARFDALKAQYGHFVGLHGSPFENFYSILHNGLNNHVGRNDNLFGEGIYLSSQLQVACNFARAAPAYRFSRFGQHPMAVLGAEIVNHPDVQTSQRAAGAASGLPETYYVIRNNEHVRASFVLIFASADRLDQPSRTNSSRTAASHRARRVQPNNNNYFHWWQERLGVLLFVAYVCVLVGIYLSSVDNRRQIMRELRRYINIKH